MAAGPRPPRPPCSTELAVAYFDIIGRATRDQGASVRKRAVKVGAGVGLFKV